MTKLKRVACLFIFFAISSASTFMVGSENSINFQKFSLKARKQYQTPEIKQYRQNIFNSNLERIKKNNANPSKAYTMGVTIFSDMTFRQFTKTHLGAAPQRPTTQDIARSNKVPPRVRAQASGSIDWTKKKKVTPVRDQGSCGSCWAFASSAAMESAYLIAGTYKTSYKRLHISEQQQVDCIYSDGCNGGWMMKSFQYAMKKGLKPAKRYPYVGYAQSCTKKKGKYKLSSYYYKTTSCNDVKNFLMQQPLTVTVDASRWYDIGEDIFSYQPATWNNLNHAVLLTGFQENGGKPYWIIKNSWGQRWGDQGYAKLAYGSDGNNSGICLATPYPIV